MNLHPPSCLSFLWHTPLGCKMSSERHRFEVPSWLLWAIFLGWILDSRGRHVSKAFALLFHRFLPLRGFSSKESLGTWNPGLCIPFAGCVRVKASTHPCLGAKVLPRPLDVVSAHAWREAILFFPPVWLDQGALSYFPVGSTSRPSALGEETPEEGIRCSGSAQTMWQELSHISY